MKMKKVSIVIPIYNVQKYLPQCLDSIRSQTYQQWEAILIDDGSSDDSGKICDDYAEEDTRFRVIHKQNGGAASAKNCGLDCVTGDYITFIDSDDYVESLWLEKIIEVAEREAADIVEFDFDKIFLDHKEQETIYFGAIKEFSAEEYLTQYLSCWTSSLFWNKLFVARLLKNVRFRKERRCIDDEFFTYKAVSYANKIVRINDVLYHYRQRGSSAVSNRKNQQQIAADVLEVLIERYIWICQHFPKLRKTYLSHDVEIMFFFAEFSHTDTSVKKFREVSRYYMWQTIRYQFHLKSLKNAIRLQMISNQQLLKEKREVFAEQKLYFE